MLVRFRAIKMTMVDRVIIPNPPTWMRAKTVSCPVRLSAVPVSTTTSPVTQVAEVAVNKAFTNPRLWWAVDAGSISKTVPINKNHERGNGDASGRLKEGLRNSHGHYFVNVSCV